MSEDDVPARTHITITIGERSLAGELNDSKTAAAFAKQLPLEVRMSRWGDEYYGDLGVRLGAGVAPDARTLMEVGELAYWPPGNALCIFFGPTPASEQDEPRAASEVNPLGRLHGDVADVLRKLGGTIRVRVERG
jgi:hypothetical protein